jgi:hypothetical protein
MEMLHGIKVERVFLTPLILKIPYTFVTMEKLATALANTQAAATLNSYGDAFLSTVYPTMDAKQGVNYGLPLMQFHEAILIVVVYCIVICLGYYFMRGRQENSILRPFQYIYNALQVAACGYLVVETLRVMLDLGYKPICNTFESNAEDKRMPHLLYLFYLTKAFDFFDTVFIVFHKKDKQLSFLHVYHHCTIFMTYWVNANVFYSGDIYYTIIANGAVHFVMYGYYLASMFKSVDKNGKGTGLVFMLTQAVRPWITSMQLLQFVTMMAQAIYILYNDCQSPLIWVKYYLGYIFSLFLLFMNFFIQNYLKKKGKKGGTDGKKGEAKAAPAKSTHRMSTRSKRGAANEKDKSQ